MSTLGTCTFDVISKPGELIDISLARSLVDNSCMAIKGLEMNECDAPESNNTLAGIELTERVPMITSEDSSA
jgi:hypothetical protein